MKKTVLLLMVILTLSLCIFAGCGNRVPEKPEDTDLEFWISEDVAEVDFSQYNEIVGWFGAREYYGKGYAPAGYDEDGVAIDPPYYVKYLVSAYPDYSDGGKYVTSIRITDPSVSVYGINCDNSFGYFDMVMRANGYKVTVDDGQASVRHTASLGKARIILIENKAGRELIISVTVTNKHHIVF